MAKATTGDARVLAIANQKGGVGKTTTAVNLGTALAACEYRTLIVDMDPQGNASTGFGLTRGDRKRNVYGPLMDGDPVADVIVPTDVPGLELVPSAVDLAGAEVELVDAEARETRLRSALAPILERYDYILVDCPPALGLLTINAFVAGHAALVPLQAEFYALEGLSHLMRTIERVRKGFNPDLEIEGVVLTMYDRRNNLCAMVAQDVREYLSNIVYDTVIPRNVRVSEAPSHGKPVIVYDMKSSGAKAYIKLAGELLRREKGGAPAMAS
ncbi:ParA family protein [Limimonas halophila]|uniref:ParA family protein n=1 Tax=Limimonas halophila TaxID=1082479 RepID=UPI000B7CFEFB|nr:ParA family protein [Limimonas halophila]